METNSFESKSKQVLDYLQVHKKITSWDAISKFGATRLASIIFNLREDGHSITSEMIFEGRKRYAIYHYAGRNVLNNKIKAND
jgi:hypothetical protein